MVRLYNFDTEDNYVLQPVMQDDAGAQGRIACLASDLKLGLLAVGTGSGTITVFKYTAPPKDGDPVMDFTKCWETQPAFQVRVWGG